MPEAYSTRGLTFGEYGFCAKTCGVDATARDEQGNAAKWRHERARFTTGVGDRGDTFHVVSEISLGRDEIMDGTLGATEMVVTTTTIATITPQGGY